MVIIEQHISIKFNDSSKEYTPKHVKTPCGQYFAVIIDYAEALTDDRRGFTKSNYRGIPNFKRGDLKYLEEEVSKVL